MAQKMTPMQKAIMAEIRRYNSGSWRRSYFNDGIRFVSMERYEDEFLKEFDIRHFIGRTEYTVSMTRYRVICRYNTENKFSDSDLIHYMVIVRSDGVIDAYLEDLGRSK